MSETRQFAPGPVIVGGLGGSGTRVLAQILVEIGFYLGRDLNPAYDNLWFTLLFRRPRWLTGRSVDEKKIAGGLKVLEKAMLNSSRLSLSDWYLLSSIVCSVALKGHNHRKDGRGCWPLIRARNFVTAGSRLDLTYFRGWGWKEPCSHVYLPYFKESFPQCKYIHVVRHGLDMAFSRKQKQLYHYGALYGVEPLPLGKFFPKSSLQYWIRANQKAINVGESSLGSNFLHVDFDDLCLYPERNIARLLEFLEVTLQEVDMTALCQIPCLPESMGRFKKEDLSIFSKAELDSVKHFGYSVDPEFEFSRFK